MRDTNTIKSEIAGLQNKIEDLKNGMKVTFKLDLQDLIEKYKDKIDRIVVGINNHEFNDGDQTYFGLHYEDMTLVYSDAGGVEREQTSYGDYDNAEMETIREEFIKLFAAYDVDGFYETMYGDDYEEISIWEKE
jgi:hypothetical protein